uniref:J domain-containing protein n=1 Tax=Alexandrium catenella TaxID=2925 RepID=A0A7S1QNG8_ALECA|mmetsp:Transcript_35647/g.96705  ORF Transcript_35647/g.96705 Transcript_35647/m.96705 type:complete len:681 (+) Transcript_35647:114-2156(+)|eukprot:CAMPEP_0171170750 /NCGR_PEP_ID=MMETSP0790-20130122/8869_1 /TAXON_ID=2925 /ORGANISM="Alexandrium catenella, Strain OF101" /LENGTH=680 /DNA_ID=CAMNT_0011635595 /DNA_START=108 /DNA_END=2150 /DNA_ORIENTATION=+
MSGGFRDSFTKEDTKEDILGYDDTAFYYFVITVLTCVALPWTLSAVHNVLFPGEAQLQKEFPKTSPSGCSLRYCNTSEMVAKVDDARKEVRRATPGKLTLWTVKLSVLAGIWVGIFSTVRQLGQEKEIKQFDPFDILEVRPEASNSQIKRAYRKLSLVYHPDKNPDDPLAASRFIQITKAYQALTDEVAKRNWEKYGNPDGPQTTKVGIGLPRFLLEKDHNLMILCIFFFFLILVIPITFICYYQRTKNFAANGVMIDTLQFLGYYVTESTRMKAGPELLGASAESRAMEMRPTDHDHVQKLAGQVQEHKRRSFTLPIVMKNQYLIWAHMQRRHHLMTPELRSDCDQMLKQSMKITQAMIEIACMREWFATAQAMLDFRRCLVQALDVKSSQLLQIPHVTEEALPRCHAGRVANLSEFIEAGPEQRKAMLKFEPDKMADVEAFCQHAGEIELKANLEVEDEGETVVGDVATVTVQMLRKHLGENEAIGPAHAPFFPEPKFEEWWFFLVAPSDKEKDKDKTTSHTRIVHFERILARERFVEEKLRFQVTNAGQNTLVLHALCDAYQGMDKRVELTFLAQSEEELKREFHVHEEDEDLDLQPTLFQQWMGDLAQGDESEDEEEEETQGGSVFQRRTARRSEKEKGQGDEKGAGEKAEAEKGAKAQDEGDNEDSGDSSSESDD